MPSGFQPFCPRHCGRGGSGHAGVLVDRAPRTCARVHHACVSWTRSKASLSTARPPPPMQTAGVSVTAAASEGAVHSGGPGGLAQPPPASFPSPRERPGGKEAKGGCLFRPRGKRAAISPHIFLSAEGKEVPATGWRQMTSELRWGHCRGRAGTPRVLTPRPARLYFPASQAPPTGRPNPRPAPAVGLRQRVWESTAFTAEPRHRSGPAAGAEGTGTRSLLPA